MSKNRFHMQTNNLPLFSNFIKILKEFQVQLNIDFSEYGLSVTSLDGSNVLLLCAIIKKECFTFYKCQEHCQIGVTLDSIAKILKCGAGAHQFTISQKQSDVLDFSFIFEGQQTAEFVLKLLDLEVSSLAVPVVDYNAIVYLPSKIFSKTIADFESFGDVVTITVDSERVSFYVDGDIGNGKITFEHKKKDNENEESTVIVQYKADVTMQLSISYLVKISKTEILSPHLVLGMNPEQPILLEYMLVESQGFIKYYLAPKAVEN